MARVNPVLLAVLCAGPVVGRSGSSQARLTLTSQPRSRSAATWWLDLVDGVAIAEPVKLRTPSSVSQAATSPRSASTSRLFRLLPSRRMVRRPRQPLRLIVISLLSLRSSSPGGWPWSRAQRSRRWCRRFRQMQESTPSVGSARRPPVSCSSSATPRTLVADLL